jgi:hypothetical protein
MPVIDMSELDTQSKPMYAIAEVLQDYYDNCINSKEALGIINSINCEWKF